MSDHETVLIKNTSGQRLAIAGHGEHGLLEPDAESEGPLNDAVIELASYGAVQIDKSGDGLAGKTVEELAKLADERGVSVQGTGANGNVTKPDLLKALKA